MNLEKPDYTDYISKLSSVSGVAIKTFEDLKKALVIRIEFFASMGCCVSDHALEYVMYEPATDAQIEAIFAKAMAKETITRQEEMQFKTAFMTFVSGEYNKRNWVLQLHYERQ